MERKRFALNIDELRKIDNNDILLDVVVTILAVMRPIFYVDMEDLKEKDVVVTGTSKGKGFTGVMKRWGFAGGQATHGQSNKPRAAGSIGSQTPGRVFKGKKMAGRKGNKKVSIKGLKIVDISLDEGLFSVSGPIPGARNSKVSIKVLEWVLRYLY